MNVMIIPAAGRGTRLNFDGPKLLYPLDGKTLLAYLIERYEPYIDKFVVVVNPEAELAVTQELTQLLQDSDADFMIDFQTEATGMLDAITIPMTSLEQFVEIKNVWISWCDQASITAVTAKNLAQELAALAKQSDVYMALPIAKVTRPYIHMQRDNEGKIVAVLQRRENDEMPEIGENDCGLFALSRAAYFNQLQQFANIDQTMGSETKERNFLPFIAWLNRVAPVSTFAASSDIETLGVNTVEDAERLVNAWQ